MAQAIWADEFARSIPDADESDNELWHVRLSSDEVKVLSLDQLDDLFRLSIVDESTLVWQEGMQGWLPLGEVAGLDDEPAPPPAPPPPRAPVYAAPTRIEPLVGFGVASAPQPAVIVQPAYQSVAPESARMISVSDIEPYQERRGGFGRWLVALAVLSGLAVTLYRNDVLRGAAISLQAERAYTRLEQALGGPSFGTPRAVAALTGGATGEAAAAAPVVEPAPAASTPAPAEPAPSAEQKPEASAAADEPKAEEPKAVSLDSLPLEEKVSAALEAAPLSAGIKAPAPKAKAAPAPRSLKESIAAAARGGKKPAKRSRGSASDYDPMNGKL